jgi:hypothetical protein
MWAGLPLYDLVYQGGATVSIHVGRLKVRPSFIIYGDPLKRGAINAYQKRESKSPILIMS